MQRLSPRILRTMVSSLTTFFTQTSSLRTVTAVAANPNVQIHQQKAIPCDFLKWSSLCFSRTSKFAAGFSPSQPKLLDSILDIERAKNKSPEDLPSIWDDVCNASYHLGRGHIGASMKAQLYRLLEYRAADCRICREQGLGDVVFTRLLTDTEAEWLLETIQSFYLNDVRYKLVERFNKESWNFEFKDVLRALNMPVL